jgi:SAM-dependent methyltransferase
MRGLTPDKSFDLVVSFGVLEHVPNDLESAGEIRRILKDRGRFYVAFLPYRFSWTQRLDYLMGKRLHNRLYDKRSLRQLMQNAGFRVNGIWHGQIFPKNSVPHNNLIERFDRFLTANTWFKFLSTNLEAVMTAQ